MSRLHDSIVIHPARNGFIVEATSRTSAHPGTIPPTYVFEGLAALTKWLAENYCEGEQPSNNGA